MLRYVSFSMCYVLQILTDGKLCDRSYGNVTFVGAHDSYAVGVNNRELAYILYIFTNA